ncbi:MAG TPA: hypothetical protein VIJ18_11815 [Microbacteriaceae bacterium]
MTTPQPPQSAQRPELLGFRRARLPGTSAFARRVDRLLPDFFVRHGLLLIWLWVAIWAALALTEELTDIPGWVFTVATILIVIPSLTATALCLWVTPRYQLLQTESILTHFVARFAAVVFGFIAWTVSIVIGASISSLIQLLGENKESQVLGSGFELMGAITPIVSILIWLGLIMRCSWFLLRLRGWRAVPARTELPDTFLDAVPRVRRFVITLAHPGVLAIAGVLSAIGTVLAVIGHSVIDITL